ncbi:zinc finger and SCAN domain-containing protein 10 [Anthonomus grandis grandis]|uniref:zinc finger and SCAN domain-containing protein 10 n=1 Tax=Anthonomus grandis grandis TaxID=2921223 RepID=UPI0021657F92|nr:zinc finger and SCAN domain-containing protein 10 [Anthonomus grandis grandis]XP_050295216.1 zinc finger and SCAN domain-containing protein 10 [Anthonomus grandis grandis]XP_050295217.1 zinc finger and SCAN domain-containing protein 10 [Anthonomus grandis grandis]XP_050295218.1 zinc finger and SCAN domain-containing protein 10 [Anthonomus grandis grandis]
MTMAESTLEAHVAPTQDKTNNNNHPMVHNHNHRPMVKQRKRKRLSQVLDKLTGAGVSVKEEEPQPINNNLYNNNEGDKEALSKKHYSGEVFRFDQVAKQISEEDDVFSPASSSNKSPHSSTESPRISFSPLRIKEDDTSPSPPTFHHRGPVCPCYQCVTGAGHHPPPVHPYDRFFPASPISPLTPASPAPSNNFERYLHSKYLPDIFRRRSHSDSDLPLWFENVKEEQKPPVPWPLAARNPPVDSRQSPQEFPLDLSMKGIKAREKAAATSLECLTAPPPLPLLPMGFLPPRGSVSVPVVKGDVASPTTKESVASRYNLEVSPVVEEMPPGSDVAFVCPICGQMFSLHDRLAKHMASRHKSRQNSSESTAKAYLCEVCKRSFARSDMLTRHMRLHTGIKPYTCRVCGQVFSRSDHLSTHQRTHTGEKPYKCPQCPYAACRRDMITRHMRTHTRYEPDGLNSAQPVKTESSQ